MKKRTNIQDTLLNQCRKANVKVTVYTVSGFPVIGHVVAFDDYTLLMKTIKGDQNLVFKSAISTIIPEREVDMQFNSEEK